MEKKGGISEVLVLLIYLPSHSSNSAVWTFLLFIKNFESHLLSFLFSSYFSSVGFWASGLSTTLSALSSWTLNLWVFLFSFFIFVLLLQEGTLGLQLTNKPTAEVEVQSLPIFCLQHPTSILFLHSQVFFTCVASSITSGTEGAKKE